MMIRKLPEPLARAVQATLDDWKSKNKVQRLGARDRSLWTGADEGKWLGWLGIVDQQLKNRQKFQSIAEQIRVAGFTQAALLGMA
jgi:transaldolase / glucose-6-phosphate isomerase